MKNITVISAMAIGIMVTGCGAQKGAQQPETDVQPEMVTVEGRVIGIGNDTFKSPNEGVGNSVVKDMPHAVVYRMSGDYADNVAVTLAPDGSLANYPAPGDITELSAPIALEGGWWLDRRGVSERTVFLRYTLSEYAALEQTPSPEQILDAVIPGARVSAVLNLPMTTQEAQNDINAVNAAVKRVEAKF